jgi:hypothetical protein
VKKQNIFQIPSLMQPRFGQTIGHLKKSQKVLRQNAALKLKLSIMLISQFGEKFMRSKH